jgi:hypothetical protein
MRLRCRCGRLASTERACQTCGTAYPMVHTHGCEQDHWISSDPNTHSLANCPHAHMHPYVNWNHTHAADGALVEGERKSIPLAERTAFLLTVPWISRVKGLVGCDGICWSRSSMSRRQKCKKNAKFAYRPLKKSPAVKGNYCWSHLPISMSMEESDRFDRWVAKNPPPWRSSDV